MKSISVRTGSYTTKDGKEKWKYFQIGALIEKSDGTVSIKFDDIVTNYLKPLFGYKFEGRANIYDNQEKDKPLANAIGNQTDDSDLPF